ncbi:MAG: LysM peptidoglycan-binding domain-containing protein [Candidatus Sabulitectum sp.]|nr:LysM peptidoglycan-binding domain-containing protein [Candidatus Sabulitectum sp.]
MSASSSQSSVTESTSGIALYSEQPLFQILHGTSGRVEAEVIPLHAPYLSDLVYTPEGCPAADGTIRLLEALLRSQGAPSDLAALPWVESSYYVGDYSRVGAAGPWQFMSGTARHFRMNMTDEIDERYSWTASTRTASDYLLYLNRLFDDWHLALAAYNCGEGVVQRALSDALRKEYGMIELPGETDAFVPRYSAALQAVRQLERKGPELSVVMVPPGLDLRLLAAESGIDPEVLAGNNRGFLREITPVGQRNWEVVVPSSRASLAFQSAWSMRRDKYVVKSGDSWASIGQATGVSAGDLMEANSSSMPSPGCYMYLPESGRVPVNSNAAVSAGFFQYTVRSGDSLGGIGVLVGVSSREVALWNDMSTSAIIHPGQKLLLRGTPPEGSGAVTIVRADGEVVHIVQAGDSMWALAVEHGVSVEQIMELNNKDSAALSIGENLIIKPE